MTILENNSATSTRRTQTIRFGALAFVVLTIAVLGGCGTRDTSADADEQSASARPTAEPASGALVADGKQVFRFDTMGNEQLWTDKLRLHEVVEKNVDPNDRAQDRAESRRGRAASGHPRKSGS